jgi:hypothetical protein
LEYQRNGVIFCIGLYSRPAVQLSPEVAPNQ